MQRAASIRRGDKAIAPGIGVSAQALTTFQSGKLSMVRMQFCSVRRAALCAVCALVIAACGKFGAQTLWSRDFAKFSSVQPVADGRGGVTGYWEGEISMGFVRAKIEADKITLAIRCDSDGKIVAQGTAPIAFTGGEPAKMTLQSDLLSAGGDVCGFRFNKGNEFAYSMSAANVLKLNFAGTSVSELTKLADLETSR